MQIKREWMIEAREKKSLTQMELAKQIGISHRTIGHFETGYRTPSIVFAKKVAKALDVDWTKFYEHIE